MEQSENDDRPSFKAFVLFEFGHYQTVEAIYAEDMDDAANDVAEIIDKMREFGFVIVEWWVVQESEH